MAVKFLEITSDPFTNNTSEFVLILTISTYNYATPSSPGASQGFSGELFDASNKVVGYIWETFSQDYEVTGTLSNEAYAHSWTHDQKIMLIPPGYKFTTFVYATALQGSLEDLAPFIKGMN